MADTIMINSFRSEQQQYDEQVDNQDSKIQMKTRSVIVPKHLTIKIESMSYVAQQMKKMGMKGQNILLSEIGSLDGLVQQNQLLSIMTQRMMEFEFRANDQERAIHVPIQQRVQQFAFNPLILQQQVSQIKCNICLGFVDNQLIVEPCKHIFCNECTQNYITNKIITGEVLKITCPEQDCQTEFDDDFIKSQICDSIYTKFLKFRRIKQHENIKNGRWCPKPECENFVYQDPRYKDLYCPCGQQFCFDCGNPSHPNKNCEEAIDQGFLHAVKQYSIHKCPKCKSFIQKNEGCNHMTCQHCYYEFCWLCSQRYSALHYDCWNPCCCPGDQHTQRAPYKYPRLLIGIRAILKIILYILLSPLAVAAGAGAIIYVILVLLCKGICVVTEAIQDCC